MDFWTRFAKNENQNGGMEIACANYTRKHGLYLDSNGSPLSLWAGIRPLFLAPVLSLQQPAGTKKSTDTLFFIEKVPVSPKKMGSIRLIIDLQVFHQVIFLTLKNDQY